MEGSHVGIEELIKDVIVEEYREENEEYIMPDDET